MRAPRQRGGGRARTAGALALASLCLASACVVEERRPSRPSPRSLPGATTPSGEPAPAPVLPPGPLATPAPLNSTTSAAVRFAMLPLGTVPYDGQVLPLVSPDGRFMAIEEGTAPSWPTLLAQADAAPALGTRLTIYDISVPPLRALPPAEPLPVGAILGRACDSRGFLLEWPRPDGARWIGRCAWVGGKVEWLVQDEHVNAHAALSAAGALAWTRRGVGAKSSALVVRDPDAPVRTLEAPDTSYALPIFSAAGRILFAAAITPDGLEFLAWRLEHEGGPRVDALGPPIARRVLATGGDIALAYQVLAPAQHYGAPGPARAGNEDPDDLPVLLFHPSLSRMCAFDWRNAAFLPLSPKSIAAVRSPIASSPGYFQTTPSGLVFTPPPPPTGESARTPEARVMDTPFVPRATADPQRPLVLLGPGQGSRLQVVGYCVPAQPKPAAQ